MWYELKMEHTLVKRQTETIFQPTVIILGILIKKYHHLNSPASHLLPTRRAVLASALIQAKLPRIFLQKGTLSEGYMLILLILKYSKYFKLF